MSWREIVNWNPEPTTQFTHNTHNSRIGSSEINSAYYADSALRTPDKGRSTTRIALTTESAEPASIFSEEAEELIQSVIDWVDRCLPGDEWQMQQDLLSESDELRQAADEEIRKRNPNLRVWRTGEDKLACKVWLGPEPPSYRPPRKSTPRFRGADSKRIQTMWSEEHQSWCQWDAVLEDYVVAPEFNRESK